MKAIFTVWSFATSLGDTVQVLPLVLLFLMALIFAVVICANGDNDEESPPPSAAEKMTAKKTTRSSKPATLKKLGPTQVSNVTAKSRTSAAQEQKHKKVASAKTVISAKPVKSAAKPPSPRGLVGEQAKVKSNAAAEQKNNGKKNGLFDSLSPLVDGGKTVHTQRTSDIKGHHSYSSTHSKSSYAHIEPRKTEKLDLSIASTIPDI